MATLDDLQARHDALMAQFAELCATRANIEQSLTNGIPADKKSALQRQLTVVTQDIESTQRSIEQLTVVF